MKAVTQFYLFFECVSKQKRSFTMLMFTQAIKNFFQDEEGVTAIEYALIAALIAVAIIAAVTLVGTDIAAVFTNISNKLQAIPAAP